MVLAAVSVVAGKLEVKILQGARKVLINDC